MIYIIWLLLLILLVLSFFTALPFWVPVLIYLLVVFFRVKEKVGNYNDWLKINKRDEKLKLEEVASDMAERGLALSGIRKKEEAKVVEDFNYKRKKKKRELENDLISSLFLK